MMRELRNQVSEVRGKERVAMWLPCTALGVRLIVYTAFLLAIPQLAYAAVFNCSSSFATGDVDCLINAINTANGNGEDDVINLEAGTYILTSASDNIGANGLPVIASKITINGASLDRSGAITTIIRRADRAPSFRILKNLGTLNLDRISIENGSSKASSSDSGDGGGIANSGTLKLTNSAVKNNRAEAFGGGGIANFGKLTVINSTVSRNEVSENGGGIFNVGKLTLIRSTVNNNKAALRGGGIANGIGGSTVPYKATVDATNSTIALNEATLEGGGIRVIKGLTNEQKSTLKFNHVTIFLNSAKEGGGIWNLDEETVRIKNSILGNNLDTDSTTSPFNDCAGTVISEGYNLISVADTCNFISASGDKTGFPGLDGGLQDNCRGNGCTATYALLIDSPAIDAVPLSVCLKTDQRGFVRPAKGSDGSRSETCDIGAFEFGARPACGQDLVGGNPVTVTMGCTVDGVPNTLCQGGPNDDTITGTSGFDVIHGLGGNDTINGLGGNSRICGGTGEDTLNGDGNVDFVFGGDGRDTLNGGASHDLLNGGVGDDELNGNAGNDFLFGGRGDDTLNGGNGNDTCNGGDHINGDSADVSCETTINIP